MRNGRRLRGWGSLTLAMMLTTLTALLASPAVGYYAQIYPGDVVITNTESLDRALAEAKLLTSFESDILTENESARFTATVVYETAEPPDGVDVEVAFRNDATLTVTAGQANLSPDTPTRQNLAQGFPWPGGGFALEWRWEVIPRTSGQLKLQFEIQPVLFTAGGVSTEGAKVNKPIEITVAVHPNRLAFDEIVSAAQRELEVRIPSLGAGDPAEVTASLPLRGHQEVVQAAITLETAMESEQAVVEELDATVSSGDEQRLVVTWLVTPADEGVVKLTFTVAITATAGDVPLASNFATTRTVAADPSLWDRVQSFVAGATAILALIGALVALKTDAFGVRTWLKRRWPRRTAPAAGDGDS